MNNIGIIIKELRIEQNLNQEALAEILSVNRSLISQYENNITKPSLDIIIKLCRYFKVSADYLLGLTDY